MMSSTRGCPRGRLVRVAPVVRSSESIAAEGGPLDPTRILRSPLTWGVVATCSQRNKGGSGKSAQLGTPAQPQYWYEATLAASSSPSDTAQTDGTVAGDTLGDTVSAAPVARAVAATSQPTAAAAGVTPFHHVRLPKPVRVYRTDSRKENLNQTIIYQIIRVPLYCLSVLPGVEAVVRV